MTDASNEDTRRRFGEALERKNHQAGLSTDHKDGHPRRTRRMEPADHKREFRRRRDKRHIVRIKRNTLQFAWRVCQFVAPTGFEPALPP